ncbi:hypothetical protein D8674_020087 [Pyrus ussuriensis x Pyrus communis]|uniref:Uncharacterized protein n=1 Tax=Pyrus ussuriensis x Pyrus communis TaxID=2448454 RepID=A0A5N5HEN7_9ROSA|nr:hypothetical protein D8674_020087 [Pyrus ussuriensis x Pyrus communis]
MLNALQRDLGAELLKAEVDSGFLVQSSSGLRLILGWREIPSSWCRAPPNPSREVDSWFLVQSSSGLRLILSLQLQHGGGTKHGALGVSNDNQCTTASNNNNMAMSPQLISNFGVSTSNEIKDDRRRSTATTTKKTRIGYEDGASLLQQ